MKIAAISIADYAEATEGMPHDAERLFFRILLKMYSRGGALPDNDSDNARMFGYDTRRYKRLKYILLKFPRGISIVDGEIRNSRVDKELLGIAARKQMLREAGAKGGKSDRSRIEVGSKLPRIGYATTSKIRYLREAYTYTFTYTYKRSSSKRSAETELRNASRSASCCCWQCVGFD